ncbi:hypothetical protein N657DRAFT_643171 [Parathielavia appendiculata]|uniref:DUF967 domain protein n=1 Tax=Parathielavia appendiculata TaxID=2587402 RepID=A0AAN6U4T2_9PEZI|nr:hypothetical protein N657DRAFT_643171 [Parathielavia appendiculata]
MALAAPSTDPAVLIAQETSDEYTFRSFTAETAWTLGVALRERLLSLPQGQRKPALISISLTNGQVVFQCATEPGTVLDNETWVRRKRNTVLRWGVSSWAMRMKMAAGLGGVGVAAADEVEATFVKKFTLVSSNGGAVADDYCIHGGGYPVRVRGVEGLVAIVVVSGLKQEDDHAVVVETVREVVAAQGE